MLAAGGLPEDALLSSARVLFNGRTSITVEGQQGVVALSPEQIQLKTGSGLLTITGRMLALRELSPERAIIQGETIDGAAYR